MAARRKHQPIEKVSLHEDRRMISKLNRATAVAQQHYDELVKLVSLDDIESGKLGTGAKRKRVEWLLEKLDQAIREIPCQIACLV